MASHLYRSRVSVFTLERITMIEDRTQRDLEGRVRAFIQDNYNWECFVQDNFDFDAQKGTFEIAIRYCMMVDKYCVTEKRRHDGISLANHIHHLPQEETIFKFVNEGERATVYTQVAWQSGHRKGMQEIYDYEFEKIDDEWFLDQIYLNAPRGRFECL